MIDLAKLASQGRAFSPSRPWESAELEALILIERERGIARVHAADYVRNGILTLEAYDKAVEAKFKPKTLDEAKEQVEATLKNNEFAGTGEAPSVEAPQKASRKPRATKEKK